jgi:hypothetical protein
MVVYVLTCFWN